MAPPGLGVGAGKLSCPGPGCGFDKFHLLGTFSDCALGLLETKSDLTIGKDILFLRSQLHPAFDAESRVLFACPIQPFEISVFSLVGF